MSADGSTFSVNVESLSQSVGGLTSREEALLGQLLALFPIPRPEHAGQLLAAIGRIAASVPWFEAASGFPAIAEVAAGLEARFTERFGPLERLDVADRLTGSNYLLTRALIGKEPEPMPGPESLRAALLACGLYWLATGKRRRTSLEQLGMAIRQVTEHHLRPTGRQSPLLPYLKALGGADSLPRFITVSAVLVELDYETVSPAWRKDFLPTLQDISGGVSSQGEPTVPSPPQSPGPKPKSKLKPPGALDPDEEDEENDDRLTNAIRRVVVGPGGGEGGPLPGEPPDETSASAVVNAIPLTRKNPDAKKVARYLASQAIWGSNHLLLTNHPDVLPLHWYRQVVRALMEEIGQQTGTTDLSLGLVALLLQAITGRTAKTLSSFQLLKDPAAERQEGACGLSLDHGFLELDVFWQLLPEGVDPDKATGYFRPEPSEARYFEPAGTKFRLPLHPTIADVLRPRTSVIGRLAGMKDGRRDECLRLAARHLRGKVGFPLVLGDVRRSFSAHLYERCRDTALTQLIAVDTLGQSDGPLHYYAPREGEVAKAYWSFLNDLLRMEMPANADTEGRRETLAGAGSVDPPMPKEFESNRRIGAAGLVTDQWAKRLASTSGSGLNSGIAGLMERGGWREIHDMLVTHLACMLMVVAGHRPVDALFQLSIDDIHLDANGGAALFRDKVNDSAHDPRFAALAPCLVKQIQAYLAHLQGLVGISKVLAAHVEQVLQGRAPLLFGVDENGGEFPLTIATWRPSLPAEWRNVRLNWGRTWIRTRGVELGLSPEFAAIQLGHLEAVGYPFSNASPTVPKASLTRMAPHLEKMARLMGWRVRTGIPGATAQESRPVLLPLRDWSGAISVHEAKAKNVAKQCRHKQAAKISTYRQRAEKDVLAHPVLVERGIPAMWHGDSGAGEATPLTRGEAEALRDVMFEQVGDDPALGIARSWALRRILGRVNKRLGIHGQDPAPLGVFRRPVDNAFVPGMMTAVRQVEALRDHATKLGSDPPGDWKDLPRAFARVAYVMAVFGFMENPDQILGVLQHRAQGVSPAGLPDAMLVPWGDRPEQVVALRGVSALSLARLAKRYPDAVVPDHGALNEALLGFLPDWALPANGRKLNDPLKLLCGTVGLANRFELSPAARYALDPVNGSTSAAMGEQLALIDSDPVGTLVRDVDAKATAEGSRGDARPMQTGTANARSQYLALCRLLPSTGKALELPLTGITVPAHRLVGVDTRNKVIAEVDAMIGEDRSNKRLQPVVRLLALWVRQMLVEGTPQTKDPSDRTIETYLTRIGATLVEWFGSSALVDLGEVELEQAYLAAILAGTTNRPQAAAAILRFHQCAELHYPMPEVDMSEVMSYLRDPQQTVDAELILPQERTEILARSEAQADAGSRDADKGHGRILRQAAAALPLYALGALRRSEALGLKVRDVWRDGENTSIRVRRNRSRRIKTRAARRYVFFHHRRRPGLARFEEWVSMDSLRQQAWQRERAFVFSPLTAPGGAEGRDAIARACSEVAAEVTGRGNERLHRFRHLVAFELLIPLFLSPKDAEWMATLPVQGHGEEWSDVLLPRDLLGRVVEIGHADWRVTLRCYIHMQWLLRSRQDAAIGEQYMHRRIVAFAAGLTLPAVDKVVQQDKGKRPSDAWLDHFRDVRLVPLRWQSEAEPYQAAERHWSAVELDALFRLADRMKSLDRAILSSGGNQKDACRLRHYLKTSERRMGRRLFRDSVAQQPKGKRQRVARELDSVLNQELLDWMGGSDGEGALVMRDLFESMSPNDGDTIVGSSESIDTLQRKLKKRDSVGCSIEEVWEGFAGLKVNKIVSTESGDSTDRKTGMSLSQEIKRAVAISWISSQLK